MALLPGAAARTLLALAALAVLAAPAAAPSAARAADGVVVILGGYNLYPREAVVTAGEPVTFQVQEREDPSLEHTLVAADGRFESPALTAGQTWSVTLDEPGVYRYRLRERPSVEGVLVVR